MENEKFQELVIKQLQSLVEGQQTLEAGQKTLVGRMDTLEAGQKPLVGRMDTLEAGQKLLAGRMDTLVAGQKDIQKAQTRMQRDITVIKNEVGEIWKDIKNLDERLLAQENRAI
ncbi:MAG: hypothetical protein ACYCX4_00090 [Bacillota bacterium]